MADPEKYYTVATFSDLWKDGESPIEGTFIKGTSALWDYLCDGTDSISDMHGDSHSMVQRLEIRIRRCAPEDNERGDWVEKPKIQ